MDLFERLSGSSTLRAPQLSASFAESRQRVLAENVANVDTPGYLTKKVDAEGFRKSLRDALRRGETNEPLRLTDNGQVRTNSRGELVLTPAEEPADNALRHDGTNALLERLMTDVAQNSLSYELSTSLLRSRFEGLLTAIRGRSS